MGSANAIQTGQVTITCAKPDGTQRTNTVGWDNSNIFFDGKGDIARLYCEGGYAGEYRTFITTSVTDLALRYYNGTVPTPASSGPSETDTTLSQPVVLETVTPTVETQTPQVVETVTAPVTSDTQTVVDTPSETQTPSSPAESPTVDSPNQSDDSSSAVVETSTQTSPSVDSSTTSTVIDSVTVVVDTSTPVLDTATVPVDTSTVQSPEPQPAPLPTPPPAVEPQPVPAPVVVAPQPEPLPEPEPEPLPEVIDEEAPLEEPTEPEPVVEEPVPVDEPSGHPEEVDTNEIPIEEEIQEQPEPTPQPSPQPSVEPAPTSQPEIAYEPPTVTLDNGVILTQEEAVAVALLQNPGELLSELFTDPGAVLNALGSVGADMSPEVREKSEKVLVSAVIVGNIATQAAALAGAATYRRNP